MSVQIFTGVHVFSDAIRPVLQIRAAVDRIHKMSRDRTIDELSELVQDFYQNMQERFEKHTHYQGLEGDQVEVLLDLMENYLMSLTYKTVFEFISTADEDKDLAIQKRIRSLSWVAAQHLELELDDRQPPVRDIMDHAITGASALSCRRLPGGRGAGYFASPSGSQCGVSDWTRVLRRRLVRTRVPADLGRVKAEH